MHRQLQTGPNNSAVDTSNDFLPQIDSRINVYHSAKAEFYSPSDPLEKRVKYQEIIRCTGIRPWRHGNSRCDTVFVETDSEQPGMRGMHVARVFLFFSFLLNKILYPCALIHWFEKVDDMPDEDTGMWIVEPEFLDNEEPHLSVIHIDCLVRAAHLIPVFGDSTMVPEFHELNPLETLDNFVLFYVNKYVDYHAHEIVY